jgi:cytochrome c peroxidase
MNFFLALLFGSSLAVAEPLGDVRLAPGDFKKGYENLDYETDSLSLPARTGVDADLLGNIKSEHLGLPSFSAYQQEAPDASAIALGRKLFFDRRLSRNKTMSCAMCHIPEQGFTSNELKRPIGVEGRNLKRNAPTLLNVVFNRRLFWDARESNLAQQVWSPLLAKNEMNNPSVGHVLEQLHSDEEYPDLFINAFGETANMMNVGQALAQYQQSLIGANSRFDQWYFGRDKNALNKLEQQGFAVFMGKGACQSCHSVGDNYALFTDHQLHNTGVGYEDSMRKTPKSIAIQLAPGMSAQVDKELINSVGEKKENDLGLYEVTLKPLDRWKYRTPSLRNVALTAPYMHNGEFSSLDEVIEFYNVGGTPNALRSPLIRPLNFTKNEQVALREFLKSLTSSNVAELVLDGFAAPVGDVL